METYPALYNSNEFIGTEDVVLDIEHVTLIWLRKEKNQGLVFFSFHELKERSGKVYCFKDRPAQKKPFSLLQSPEDTPLHRHPGQIFF